MHAIGLPETIAKLVGCVNRKESTLPVIQNLCDQSMTDLAAEAALHVLDGMKHSGVRFRTDGTCPIVSMDKFDGTLLIQQQLAKRDSAGLSHSLRSLGRALDGAAQKGVKLETIAAAPTPHPVAVLAMPERVTESTVTRNDRGEIVATSTLERDA